MSYSSRLALATSRASEAARALVTVIGQSSDDFRAQVAKGLGVRYAGKWERNTEAQGMVRVVRGPSKWLELRSVKEAVAVEAWFFLLAAAEPRTWTRWDGEVVTAKSSAHRLFVTCPDCCLPVPTGRLHQHIGSRRCTSRATNPLSVQEAEDVLYGSCR